MLILSSFLGEEGALFVEKVLKMEVQVQQQLKRIVEAAREEKDSGKINMTHQTSVLGKKLGMLIQLYKR